MLLGAAVKGDDLLVAWGPQDQRTLLRRALFCTTRCYAVENEIDAAGNMLVRLRVIDHAEARARMWSWYHVLLH